MLYPHRFFLKSIGFVNILFISNYLLFMGGHQHFLFFWKIIAIYFYMFWIIILWKWPFLGLVSTWRSPKESEKTDGWNGKTLTRLDTVSVYSVNDPPILKSNSAGGSNEIKCKEMAFGLLCRKEMTQLCWLLLSGPHGL